MARVFISGGTGYMGQDLTRKLLAQSHEVRILVRSGSEKRVLTGAIPVPGNALNAESFRDKLGATDTFVHLTGVAHPGPGKEQQFRAIDYTSLKASVAATSGTQIRHFVYVSVAHPAPVMKAYIEVRTACEAILRDSGMASTILRPWYVLGPGHWWPYALKPVYALMRLVPSTRDGARRLGLVTLKEMTDALLWAVEHEPPGTTILDVPAIRRVSAEVTPS